MLVLDLLLEVTRNALIPQWILLDLPTSAKLSSSYKKGAASAIEQPLHFKIITIGVWIYTISRSDSRVCFGLLRGTLRFRLRAPTHPYYSTLASTCQHLFDHHIPVGVEQRRRLL